MPRVGGLAATTPTTQLTTALPRWLNSLQFRTVLERVQWSFCWKGAHPWLSPGRVCSMYGVVRVGYKGCALCMV